jgi:4-hydroxyphenylpyruvate dioxygenase
MTEFVRPTVRPTGGTVYNGFDHIVFHVSNAKQAASYFCLRFGFQPFAYRGLETGSRDISAHVIKQNKIVLCFTSPLTGGPHAINDSIVRAGDLAADVAFDVQDCVAMYQKAVSRGAKSILAPVEESDENGSIIRATIQTGFGPMHHSFIQRANYTGTFLPGYAAVTEVDPLAAILPPPGALFIDHVVTNVADRQMNVAADWYEHVLDFHRFWCVDDEQVHTEYSALRSTVMTDFDRNVKMPINEPADGKKKSQIQEYVEYHGGPGIQHIALNTADLISTVRNLRSRGVDFLPVPASYYVDLRKRLRASPVDVKEDLDAVEQLNILVDFDDQGYLLQLFTRPTQDRPTLFYEFIQRANHEGFGAGNFKALFQSIEDDQAKRGNLNNSP